ncbi:MAG: hypothetical protein RMY28_024520 [Nostoc sp. ChiSLP01]|nr:hypothetical protein [Nostoc sp. CmiSLP01]MDZ8282600.1 hypothetical protein [Nostoc sp. ChiSLP01]
MVKISSFKTMDTELFLQEMTIAQAETVLGGYSQTHESYPCGYIINITEGMKKPKNPDEGADRNNVSNQKINTVDNSRKIYINGMPIKEKRNITVIC